MIIKVEVNCKFCKENIPLQNIRDEKGREILDRNFSFIDSLCPKCFRANYILKEKEKENKDGKIDT